MLESQRRRIFRRGRRASLTKLASGKCPSHCASRSSYGASCPSGGLALSRNNRSQNGLCRVVQADAVPPPETVRNHSLAHQGRTTSHYRFRCCNQASLRVGGTQRRGLAHPGFRRLHETPKANIWFQTFSCSWLRRKRRRGRNKGGGRDKEEDRS